MRREIVLLCVVGLITTFGAMWLSASAALAAPLEPIPRDSVQAIKGGHDDIKQFFKTHGYEGDFQVVAATRDEALNRRYYRVRVGVENLSKVRAAVAKQWTWGRINRAVYENNFSARLPRSANLPAWWRNLDGGDVSRMMLDHRGTPKWYLVFSTTGDICMMWTVK
jgi:hypothetical protein